LTRPEMAVKVVRRLIQLIEIKIENIIESPWMQKERAMAEKVLIFGKDA
jgi:hypothetical protein